MSLRRKLLEGLAVRWADKPRGPGHPENLLRKLDPPEAPPDAVVENYRMALASISNRAFCESQKYRDQQWRAVRDDCHPDIVEFERVFIRALRKIDVPMFAQCMLRGAQDQNAAFVKGTSNARAGQSPHNYGLAVDIIHSTRAWDLSHMAWQTVGHVGKELAVRKGIDIEWGGDWDNPWDPAHWQLAHWRRLKDWRALGR